MFVICLQEFFVFSAIKSKSRTVNVIIVQDEVTRVVLTFEGAGDDPGWKVFCSLSLFLKYSFVGLSVFLSDVEAFARAMQASKGDPKEKKDDEDMSLD